MGEAGAGVVAATGRCSSSQKECGYIPSHPCPNYPVYTDKHPSFIPPCLPHPRGALPCLILLLLLFRSTCTLGSAMFCNSNAILGGLIPFPPTSEWKRKSKVSRKWAIMIFISCAAKKRPEQACLPYPQLRFHALVVTNCAGAGDGCWWLVVVPDWSCPRSDSCCPGPEEAVVEENKGERLGTKRKPEKAGGWNLGSRAMAWAGTPIRVPAGITTPSCRVRSRWIKRPKVTIESGERLAEEQGEEVEKI